MMMTMTMTMMMMMPQQSMEFSEFYTASCEQSAYREQTYAAALGTCQAAATPAPFFEVTESMYTVPTEPPEVGSYVH